MSKQQVKNQLARTFARSAIQIRETLQQNDNQQTFSATYLGNNQVQLANGDIRTAYHQGTKAVLVGDSVSVVFPIHSAIGYFTSKIS